MAKWLLVFYILINLGNVATVSMLKVTYYGIFLVVCGVGGKH